MFSRMVLYFSSLWRSASSISFAFSDITEINNYSFNNIIVNQFASHQLQTYASFHPYDEDVFQNAEQEYFYPWTMY